eukprot:GFUD01004184.1.p1 GENE.GFUD01004184.1~~GFUD01004184.1.p1  ORF type:complete len:164 (+),score=20.40 GFUD01004184.1:39-494(+)
MDFDSLVRKIPRLEKFCYCLEVPTGVRYFSLGLTFSWVLYAIGVLLEGHSSVAMTAWTTLWSVFNIAAYILVLITMNQSWKKIYFLPALYISVFNIFTGIINGILFFFTGNIFSAIFLTVIWMTTCHYFLGLKTLHDDTQENISVTVTSQT